jgi:hypothetical protein
VKKFFYVNGAADVRKMRLTDCRSVLQRADGMSPEIYRTN